MSSAPWSPVCVGAWPMAVMTYSVIAFRPAKMEYAILVER